MTVMKRTPKALSALILLLMVTAPRVAAANPLRFIADDYPRALSEARQRKLPVFVEVWAPW
jgi:hypothetical protein